MSYNEREALSYNERGAYAGTTWEGIEEAGLLGCRVELALRKALWEAIHYGRTLYGRPCSDLASFFAAVDHDGCDAVTCPELSQALTRLDVGLSAVQLDRLLATLDTNRDGVVSYREFKRWMNQGKPRCWSPPRSARKLPTSSKKPAWNNDSR